MEESIQRYKDEIWKYLIDILNEESTTSIPQRKEVFKRGSYYIFGNEDLDDLLKCELGTFLFFLRCQYFLSLFFCSFRLLVTFSFYLSLYFINNQTFQILIDLI